MTQETCYIAEDCKVNINTKVIKSEEIVRNHIECCLDLFCRAIEKRKDILEIDGVSVDGVGCTEITDKSRIKVLNHKSEQAMEVEIDTIVKTPLNILIPALITGETQRLYGVTRIVGYYSRITNWNKSKLGELQDRHKGNYGVRKT